MTPLIRYWVESQDTPFFNGEFNQGHVFDLSGLDITQGDNFYITISDAERVDMSKYYTTNNDDDIWSVNIEHIDTEDWYICYFDFPTDTFTSDFYVWDKLINNYVLLFKLVKK